VTFAVEAFRLFDEAPWLVTRWTPSRLAVASTITYFLAPLVVAPPKTSLNTRASSLDCNSASELSR
jgi:hypothetical protein